MTATKEAEGDGAEVTTNGDVGLRAHELVDAVYRSAAEGGEEMKTA